jgi:hypothetical protein
MDEMGYGRWIALFRTDKTVAKRHRINQEGFSTVAAGKCCFIG